jgi:hypothetical protein
LRGSEGMSGRESTIRHREEILKSRAIDCVAAWAAVCLLGGSVFGQQAERTPTADSYLVWENLLRVGASPDQIQARLRQQPGLMVEQKRWVAREAAANGRVIKDVDLTGQRAFPRLVSGTQFRSLATRLLELSGYLVPKLNPDSLAGGAS